MKKKSVYFILFSVPTCASSLNEGSYSVGVTKAYKMLPGVFNRSQAAAACEDLGGNLPVILTSDEKQTIEDMSESIVVFAL